MSVLTSSKDLKERIISKHKVNLLTKFTITQAVSLVLALVVRPDSSKMKKCVTNAGDWQAALEAQSKVAPGKVLWVQPAEQDLRWISGVVNSRLASRLVSIGCGCGLLEWLLNAATGLQVIGIEVNSEWWESRYTSTYIQLLYQDNEPEACVNLMQDPTTVIMFCYFNNGPAFRNYLDQFKGSCLIIIGPIKDRHSDPHPFQVSSEATEWTLTEYKQIGESNDYIAIYDKDR